MYPTDYKNDLREDETKYFAVLIGMKVRILKDVLVEIAKPRLDEVWDKQLKKWDEFPVEKIEPTGNFTNMTTFEGDIYLHVPNYAFELLKG